MVAYALNPNKWGRGWGRRIANSRLTWSTEKQRNEKMRKRRSVTLALPSTVFLSVSLFEIGSYFIAQIGYKFMGTLLPQSPKWWDYGHELPCWPSALTNLMEQIFLPSILYPSHNNLPWQFYLQITAFFIYFYVQSAVKPTQRLWTHKTSYFLRTLVLGTACPASH